MKNRKNNKKGFTIIELVIVIAVIGVLTAVLVPTFINLTQRANEASDQSLVKNLNTAIAMKEQEPGFVKPNNPSDSFVYLDSYGYNGERLIKNQKSEKKILWNKKTNRFLFEENKNDSEFAGSKPEEFYDFGSTLPEQNPNGYSHYLFEEFEGQADVDSGLDVGINEDVTVINYKNTGTERDVVIRTNSSKTNVTINAPLDTVKHYGVAGVVDIQAVAGSSYHENGTASLAKIKKGRLVVNQASEIAGLHVVATNGNYDEIKIAVVGSAELPSFTRDDVELANNQSKLVLEVQTLEQESSDPTPQNTQYVWISKDGVGDASAKVSSSKTDASAAVQQESPASAAVKDEVVAPTSAAELAEIEQAATRYAGGIGTEEKPYLIKSEAHLQSLREDVASSETDGKQYKLIDNLVLDNFAMIGSAYTPNTSTGAGSYTINPVSTFKGVLNGNNKTISYTLIINEMVQQNCGAGFFSNIKDATIKNITFNAKITCSAQTTFVGGVTGFAMGDCNFENITMNGSITTAWDVGGFIGATDDFGSGEFKNCVNNATIVANTLRTSGYSPTGGFIGQANALNSSGVLTFTNCQNNGSITVNQPQGKAATVSHFIGFVSDAHPETYNFNNCTVGQNASINVAFGQTRTKGNKTIYCAYTPSAEAIVPVIKYVGITNNTYDGNTAVAVINVDGQAQDLSRYVVA